MTAKSKCLRSGIFVRLTLPHFFGRAKEGWSFLLGVPRNGHSLGCSKGGYAFSWACQGLGVLSSLASLSLGILSSVLVWLTRDPTFPMLGTMPNPIAPEFG
jgi:hypothetical protein